jgi:hypothetical protein
VTQTRRNTASQNTYRTAKQKYMRTPEDYLEDMME